MFGNTNSTLLGSKSSAYYFNNQSVAASDWISDTTYSDFSYKATISCPGVSSTDGGMIIYNPAESLSGNYAPVMNTVTNGVEIWSKVNTAITVPTIAIFPAAGGALPSPSTATLVDYSNTSSGLSAANVQNAIDEVVDDTTDEFYFKVGESYSFTGGIYLSGGFITSSAKEIYFPIYLPKRTDRVSSASLTVSRASIRHVGGGYLLSSSQLSDLGTVTIQMGTCFLTVKVASSSALSATNNTPVAVELQTATVTFS